MTLKESIQFESKQTIYIQINYIDLFKRYSFVIITIYLTVVHMVLKSNIFKIAILVNPIKKYLEFNKNIQLKTIYKCVDIVYIMTDIIKAFVIMAIASSILSDLFSTVQKETIFGNRYQNINFIIQPFKKDIELPIFGAEFIFILEIEAIFIVESFIYFLFFKIDFSINVVF